MHKKMSIILIDNNFTNEQLDNSFLLEKNNFDWGSEQTRLNWLFSLKAAHIRNC